MGPPVAPLLPILQVFPLGACQPVGVHVRPVGVHGGTLPSLLLLLLLLLLLDLPLLQQLSLLPLVLPLPLPHLLAELVHAVERGVVDQGQEVPVPQLLVGRFPVR